MDIRKFLRKIRNERSELELLLLKRDNITVIHGLTYDRDKVITSNGGDLSEMAIKNARLLNRIDKLIRTFDRNQHKAMNIIYSLTDSVQRQVMVIYYLTRKKTEFSQITSPYTLEEVAAIMSLSFTHVRHIHGEALDILRKQQVNKVKKNKRKSNKPDKPKEEKTPV